MNKEKLDKWIKESYEIDVIWGDYECPECGGDGICEHCNDTGIDPEKNIAELLMNVNIELCGAVVAYREERFCKYIDRYFSYSEYPQAQKDFFIRNILDTFEDRISNAFIKLFEICGYKGSELNCFESVSRIKHDVNIGSDLFAGLYLLYNDNINLFFNYMLSFCNHHNIQIEKYIEARLEYSRRFV